MADDDDDYEVGFGKPPKHTQFQKGRSGNPKGRPKGSKSIPELVRKIFDEKILVNGPRGQCWMTKLEAGITQLAIKAAKGDLKAINQAIQLREKAQEDEVFLNPPVFQVNFVKSEWELAQEKEWLERRQEKIKDQES